ncbi:MAG TPA: hypothetical protein P5119_04275 [Candidatus Aminicenantes bacterium]|nr:hypothetical protein [Candidatus Aminicenantes bacterium]HRY64541.1 hypothetical protein [Candidatus Aminicenantes bacterium]HRZ71454.1 hypothetical protein [Candidatus Aminicenantes bacterium]
MLKELWKRRGLALVGCLTLSAACNGTSGPPAPQAPRLRPLTVADGSYAVGIPEGWTTTFTKSPGWRSPSELEIAAPGEEWPAYVTIAVFHYAEPQMTPEKYLFDLRGPSGGAETIAVAGRTARAFEEKAERRPPLGLSGETVPSLVRHVVVPAGSGFSVLKLDTPESAAGKYRPVYEAVVASFSPADKDKPIPSDPIPAGEYEVYAALFRSKAPGGLDSPQFFEAVPEGRLVYGTTIALEKPDEPVWPVEGFGPADEALVEDYRTKNAGPWPLTDRIMIKDLEVISPEEAESRLSASLEGPDRSEDGFVALRGGFVSLSRVGFDRTGSRALLSAAHTSPGAMRAQYLVLMKKGASGWTLDKVVMEHLLYH